MKREERNMYNYIRRYPKTGMKLDYGTTLTIPTDGSVEFKNALHDLYVEWGFHPASIRIDRRMYDGRERIIYIYGRTWNDNEGKQRSWEELYTKEEKIRFAAALTNRWPIL